MGMAYHVKELFYSLQGEGRNAGRAAVFCRFVGCNLWSGRESDRATAVCKFCDTDFVGTDGSGGGSVWGFEVAIETNGTVPLIPRIDWVCVSPKARTDLVVRGGNELKLVFPQEGGEPSRYAGLDFQFFFLQPMDGVELSRNTRLAVEYCLAHPQWRLSLQTQKILNIP
jgi:7-carboxy-7-deazaguanine synthase